MCRGCIRFAVMDLDKTFFPSPLIRGLFPNPHLGLFQDMAAVAVFEGLGGEGYLAMAFTTVFSFDDISHGEIAGASRLFKRFRVAAFAAKPIGVHTVWEYYVRNGRNLCFEDH